jgi:hypothetical protein
VTAGEEELLSTLAGAPLSAEAGDVAVEAASVDVGCPCCASWPKTLVEVSAKTAAIALAQARA